MHLTTEGEILIAKIVCMGIAESHLIQLVHPLREQLGIWWLQSVEGPMIVCPLELPLFLAKVLLPSKCNLQGTSS